MLPGHAAATIAFVAILPTISAILLPYGSYVCTVRTCRLTYDVHDLYVHDICRRVCTVCTTTGERRSQVARDKPRNARKNGWSTSDCDSGSMAISYKDMRIDEKTLDTILTQLVFLD